MSVECAAQGESGVLVNTVCTSVFGVLSRNKKSLLVNENHKRAKAHRCGIRDFRGEALGRAKILISYWKVNLCPERRLGRRS